MKKLKIIVIVLIVLSLYIGLWNIGADERCLRNALEYRGLKEGADGNYRLREIINTEDGMIMVEKVFDIKNNHGESHVTKLYQRLDGQVIKESEVLTLGSWNYAQHHFEPIDWGH